MPPALPSHPSAQGKDEATGAALPPGTILPVRLNSSLSSTETKPGQIISARIMQDVPLATGGKIREGSKVIGHVVDVSSSTDSGMARISLQFDKVVSAGRTIPIKTNLRAVAGFMAVVESGTPEGPASSPLATTQVGGDVAYTSGRAGSEASNGHVGGQLGYDR